MILHPDDPDRSEQTSVDNAAGFAGPDLRADLIARCERGVVPADRWSDRDTASAQIKLGTLRALLAAGCEFRLADDPASDERTTWVVVRWRGFDAFEWGADDFDEELFYVPTWARLTERAGEDWY